MIQCFNGEIIPTINMVMDVDPRFDNLHRATYIMKREALKK